MNRELELTSFKGGFRENLKNAYYHFILCSILTTKLEIVSMLI